MKANVTEIKNKVFTQYLTKMNLADVHLYKNNEAGCFYFTFGDFISESICICNFTDQTPKQWAEQIKSMLPQTETLSATLQECPSS